MVFLHVFVLKEYLGETRTLYKKDRPLLMFILKSFMISIYSIISIETKLVTHFSGYNTIALHEKPMLHVLNHDFAFSLIEILQNFVEVFILHWLL